MAMVFYFNHDKESTWILLDGFCGHGHSCVDLCSWLGWEDTFMILCSGARPPLLSGNPHVAVDLVSKKQGPWNSCLRLPAVAVDSEGKMLGFLKSPGLRW